MAQSKRRNWTHDQATLVLALYCQLPFGKMYAKNPQVIAVAQTIGRSPAAVALKLANFASMDPQHRRRGVGGMKNASAVDREIWSAYYGRWEELATFTPSADLADGEALTDGANLTNLVEPDDHSAADIFATVKIRQRQSFFRRMVMAAYDDKCCITGIASPALLRASHIVPWSRQTESRLDPCNGLSLNVLHDAAFDQGLMTLRDDLTIQLSKRLPATMPQTIYASYFQQYADKPVAQPQRFTPKQEYLEYHRSMVFEN